MNPTQEDISQAQRIVKSRKSDWCRSPDGNHDKCQSLECLIINALKDQRAQIRETLKNELTESLGCRQAALAAIDNEPKLNPSQLSHCSDGCGCMTHTVPKGRCGKCGALKDR